MKRKVKFSIHRGQSWEIHSDASAAVPTGGRAIAGLTLGEVHEIVDRLRVHGCVVDEGEAAGRIGR